MQHCGGAAERVVDMLLEGSLPEELAGLDSQAAQLPPQFASGAGGANSGGGSHPSGPGRAAGDGCEHTGVHEVSP